MDVDSKACINLIIILFTFTVIASFLVTPLIVFVHLIFPHNYQFLRKLKYYHTGLGTLLNVGIKINKTLFAIQIVIKFNPNMTKLIVLLTVFISVIIVVASDEKYTTRWDSLDIDSILKSDRLLRNYINCLLEQGRCTSDGQELKSKLLCIGLH